ncbi:MAG: Class III signal peptide [Methanobacterium sp. PtaU1.Bin097]|jgi:hypothetical protein|nr:MAG: Class III signal peptide [Methanobacterium sp. PtaU1.Bin097]HNS25515.1 class III signal peptide-containing protein [Methanobacteriaceae archaeon]
MDSRGQASAEYIFLILIFLIVLALVTVPLAGRTINATQNVSVTSDAKTALSTIANGVNVVYSNGPGAKRTVNVYFPQDSSLFYDDDGTLNLGLRDIPVNASNPDVKKDTVYLDVPYEVQVDGTVTKGWHDVEITWDVGSTYILVSIKPSP